MQVTIQSELNTARQRDEVVINGLATPKSIYAHISRDNPPERIYRMLGSHELAKLLQHILDNLRAWRLNPSVVVQSTGDNSLIIWVAASSLCNSRGPIQAIAEADQQWLACVSQAANDYLNSINGIDGYIVAAGTQL